MCSHSTLSSALKVLLFPFYGLGAPLGQVDRTWRFKPNRSMSEPILRPHHTAAPGKTNIFPCSLQIALFLPLGNSGTGSCRMLFPASEQRLQNGSAVCSPTGWMCAALCVHSTHCSPGRTDREAGETNLVGLFTSLGRVIRNSSSSLKKMKVFCFS